MRDALLRLLQLILFMAPAYCANMAAPFARYWSGWNRPINEALFGSHKTVVGFLVGLLAALLATATLHCIDTPLSISDADHWLALGLCSGFGAMGGDTLKSFFKRRMGLAPGARWVPFDQLDFAVGALLMTAWSADLRVVDVLAILALTFIGHVATNRLAFYAGVKDDPW